MERSAINPIFILGFSLSLLVGVSATTVLGAEQRNVQTAHYRLELDIGGSEEMYSEADAKRLKPTTGEVMVSGRMSTGMAGMPGMNGQSSMTMSGGMASSSASYHLELHVWSSGTGKAVRDAIVTMTVSGSNLKQSLSVPIAVMYGIAQGEEDWHYGNNVELSPGQYAVTVLADGDAAEFSIVVPPA